MKFTKKSENRGGGNFYSLNIGAFHLSPCKKNVILRESEGSNNNYILRVLRTLRMPKGNKNRKELINLSTYSLINFKKAGFTLTEVLLAVAIVGIIAALVLPATISKFNEKTLDLGYEREIKTISGAVDSLVVSENKKDFFSTMMYTDVEPESYGETSGKFLKKYLKISKYCGDNNGNCFASKYYTYSNNQKKEYVPEYKGSCARLKNGMSICLQPQIGGNVISGMLDVNGPKGPNVLGRDLRSFTLSLQTKSGQFKAMEDVITAGNMVNLGDPNTPPDIEVPETDMCLDENNDIIPDCCMANPDMNPEDCCMVDEYANMYGDKCSSGSQNDEKDKSYFLGYYRCYSEGYHGSVAAGNAWKSIYCQTRISNDTVPAGGWSMRISDYKGSYGASASLSYDCSDASRWDYYNPYLVNCNSPSNDKMTSLSILVNSPSGAIATAESATSDGKTYYIKAIPLSNGKYNFEKGEVSDFSW